jgi:hypothetical protein
VVAIFVLEEADVPEPRCESPTDGRAQFAELLRCVYGPLLPGEAAAMFPDLALIARSAPLWRIRRPEGRWTVPQIVSDILLRSGPVSARSGVAVL